MPQAKKKARSAVPEANQITYRLTESLFILTLLLAVYLLACLASYDPADPGPFNTVASERVSNLGRVLGAWLANALLFLTGYLAWTVPLVIAYSGWLVYSRYGKPLEKAGPAEWFARLTGLLLFVLSATGLAHRTRCPPRARCRPAVAASSACRSPRRWPKWPACWAPRCSCSPCCWSA